MSNSPEETRRKRRRFFKLMGAGVGAAAISSAIGFNPSNLFTGLGAGFIDPIKSVGAVQNKPAKLTPFVDGLIVPPALTPDTVTSPGFDYYEVPIVQGTTHKFHRDLPPTTTQSYFGVPPAPGFHYLGPTIVANRGTPVKVKVTNNLPSGQHTMGAVMDYTIMGNMDEVTETPWTDEHRVCVHLHGGKVMVEHDGGPRDWFSPVGSGQANPYPEGATIDPGLTGSHTYIYPNDQEAAMLWYHDHAWGITRFNPFLGQAAGYIIRDSGENALIAAGAIPNGPYEVPIVLQDRLFDLTTGAMIYPITENPGTHPKWIPEYFGDTPVVNGKAYPYFEVEPRRYRLRFLNGSQARFYNLWFQGPSAGNLPIWVIGSEQGFLPAPAMLKKLVISPGERFDTIVDFTGMQNGAVLTLRNNGKAPYPGGRGGECSQIMQFRVVKPLTGTDTTLSPASLTLPNIEPSLVAPAKPWREIVITEMMDPVTEDPLEALLDGLHFTDSAPPNPPLFTETDGAVNIWQFINTTGDAHPMHTHLIKFKIVNRQAFDTDRFLAAWVDWIAGNRIGPRPSVDLFLKGEAYPPAPEETGWKDTAKAYPGEVLRIIARFSLPTNVASGLHRYVCHCHILEHEENDMMFYFGVQK